MRCPRCETSVDDAAVRCTRCGAPLQLLDEPPPAALDVRLDLDRRRDRTPSAHDRASARAVEPASDATGDDRDLGDLSFDAPADDSSWSFGRVAARAAPEPLDDEPSIGDDAAPDDEDPSQDRTDELAASGDAELEPAVAEEAVEPAGPALLEPAVDSDLEDDDELEEGDELDAAAEPTELGVATPRGADAVGVTDEPAARRGRMLSLASLAVAGAIALMALLTSR